MAQESARQLRARLGELLGRLEPLHTGIVQEWQQSELEVRRAAEQRSARNVEDRLRTTALDELVKGQNVRGVAELKRLGFGSAADVLRRGAELDVVPGVGAESVRKLRERAAELRRPRLSDLTLDAAQSRWGDADHALAGALRSWDGARRLTSEGSFAVLDGAVRGLRRVLRQTVWYRWLLTPSSRRRALREEVERLCGQGGEFLASPGPTALATRLSELAHHRGVPVDAGYWDRNSADLISALDSLHRSAADPAVREAMSYSLGGPDGLSEDLTTRMRELPLHTGLLARTLRGYQEDGARFAVSTRGLLGDEMGLGKTTQALAAVAHCVAAEGGVHHAVVCPAALITTWEDETRAVVPSLRTLTLGPPAGRAERLAVWHRDGGLMLLSYDLAKEFLASLDRPVDFLVVDEAHYCKEPGTARTRTVRALAARAERCLLLTGTPLVNRIADVTSLMTIVDDRFARQLEARFADSDDVLRDPDAFRFALAGHYLRRRQVDHLKELPPLTVRDVRVQLSTAEVAAYRTAVADGNLPRMRISASTGRGAESTKLEALGEIAEQVRAAGTKLLVFSDYVDVLTLAAATIGEGALLIHGGLNLGEEAVAARERQFREAEGFAALVYQIRMGGVGKNFQQASTVVLMEPQYTAAAEEQAIRRAHRMGQTRPVFVHRLVAEGTVDERLVELVGIKRELARELTDRSKLAESLTVPEPQLPSRAELVQEERRRLGLPVDSAPAPSDVEEEDDPEPDGPEPGGPEPDDPGGGGGTRR